MEAQEDFDHACSDWHEFKWPDPQNNPHQYLSWIHRAVMTWRSPFVIEVRSGEIQSTAVVAFDKKNISNKYVFM